MTHSPESLRQHSLILTAHAKRVREAAEAARLRSIEARAMAQAASASARTHRTNSEAATCRNAVRAHVSLNYPAGN